MGHENGGWMNSDQADATKEAANAILEKAESLKRAVVYGLENGKRNLIVDLDVLSALLRGYVPVGNNTIAPEDLTELFYKVKTERDRLQASTDTIPNRRNFCDELTCLVNKYSKENASNTPDFILADYIERCLETWSECIKAREAWHGREFVPGSLSLGKQP